MKTENKMIDVDDELPADGFYLVRCPNYCESDYAIAEYDNNLMMWMLDGDDSFDKFVTHWMKLPEF